MLVHVPPEEGSLNVIVLPTHTWPLPVIIGAGVELTFTTIVLVQPDDGVNVMTAVPAVAPPVTTPVVRPMAAIAGLPLVHVPGRVDVRVVVWPVHKVALPPKVATG